MGKPLKDWTFGEAKELCQSMDHCYNCELRSGDTDCLVAEMVRICRRPMEWKMPETPGGPCPFCRDDRPDSLGSDEMDVRITEITPCPAIDLGTGKQADKADPPYYAIGITLDDGGYQLEEFIPIRYCPKCGRRLVSTRTYESLLKGLERDIEEEARRPETMTVDQALALIDSTDSDIQEMRQTIKDMMPGPLTMEEETP